MNILILSCGTRCKLVEYFKRCKQIEKVVCTDINNEAPALLFADETYLVPRMTDANYLDIILDICKKDEINAVLPLHEEELLLISKSADKFKEQGVIPIISDYSKVALCKDKYMLSKELKAAGISSVETYMAKEYLGLKDKSDEAFFVKPRYGAGSINTFKIHSKNMLSVIVDEYKDEFIVQPAITGKEYGVDIYIDLISGNVISLFCKEKLRMRAGETEKSVSVKNEAIEKLVTMAVMRLGLRGPIDVDVLEQDGHYFILEINPRFGGGYPHAYNCGVDFPELIANNCNGLTNSATGATYEENVLAMKYSEIVTRKTI